MTNPRVPALALNVNGFLLQTPRTPAETFLEGTARPLVLPGDDKVPEGGDQPILEPWVIVHQNRQPTNVWNKDDGSTDDVFLAQPPLPGRIQRDVVGEIIIALCEHQPRRVADGEVFVPTQNPVHDGYWATGDVEDDDFADLRRASLVAQQE